jgi:FkbM family methyltransferase
MFFCALQVRRNLKRHALRKLIKPIKPLLAKTVWRQGSVRTILWGPCRGLRYKIFPGMGLSPLYGGWEEQAQNLMLRHIKPGGVVYDLGANYGIHTLLFARLAKEHGHVYAFEPVQKIHSALQGNVALNRFSNVTCLRLAVSSSAGVSSFLTGHHVGAGHLSTVGDNQGEQLTVQTITLDAFVFEQNNRPPTFVKIDIEGAESKAMSGGITVLKKYRPILLIDLHNPEEDVAVGQILSECNYEAFRAEDDARVEHLSQGWPDPAGLWGQVIALAKN